MYAIVINLDYESHPEDVCSEIWQAIKEKMVDAGFRLDNRVFLIHKEREEACCLAKTVLEDMESHLEFHRKHIFNYIKDFYAYDMDNIINLMLPLGGIEVKE